MGHRLEGVQMEEEEEAGTSAAEQEMEHHLEVYRRRKSRWKRPTGASSTRSSCRRTQMFLHGLPFFPLLLSILLFPLATCHSTDEANCTLKSSDSSRSISSTAQIECASLNAFNQFHLDGHSVEGLALECGPEEEKQLEMALARLRHEFGELRQFSLHNCTDLAIQQFMANLPPNLELLNLTGNGLVQLGWQQFGRSQLKLLDLRDNPVNCSHCENAWMGQANVAGKDGTWPIRTLFPSIPGRVLWTARKCAFGRCPRESAKFEGFVPADLQLGAKLELKCHFQTGRPLPGNLSGTFVWPLNEQPKEEEAGNGSRTGEGFDTVLLPSENAALLRIGQLRSDHLGPVACRCQHCAVPSFDIVQLQFPVPLSVHIPQGEPAGEQHMILHGFPLDGRGIRMEITRREDNRTESVKFNGIGVGGGVGAVQVQLEADEEHHPKAHLLFNGSLAIRPEPAHAQFFLRYFSLSIHECAGCKHAQRGGTFHFRICTGNNSSTSKGEEANCAEISHKMEPPAHPVSRRKDFFQASVLSSSSSFSFLHFFLSIPPILLSLALLALGGRTVWRLKQRMAIREKLKRRSRRASRNTQRTEETSIPLDTMSRSLSLSNYIQTQLQVPLIDSRELQLNERIGKGAFGEVFVAIWRGGHSLGQEEGDEPMLGMEGGERKVAVKMLTSVQMDVEMDREAALLARLEHPNVLRMFGIAHWSGQIALVLELMNLGDLRNYLRNREPRCNNYAQFPPALLPTELVDICIQIAEGLCYLSGQQIVHRDLAARNCLISGESDMRSCSAAFRPPICVKISDFGMSRRLYASAEYYRMQDKKTALPVRWMPPECLSSGKFTPQSDIWSFGVLLFEIFTFGGMPFAALSNGEVLTAVLGGMRPEVPDKCQPELEGLLHHGLGDLMRQCWHRSPQKRIIALEALQRLRQLQEKGLGPPLVNGHA